MFDHLARSPALLALPESLGDRLDKARQFVNADPSGDLLKRFIAKGFDVNAGTDALSPLIFVFVSSQEPAADAVALLVRLGARTDVKNRDGRTPAEQLLHAVRSNGTEKWNVDIGPTNGGQSLSGAPVMGADGTIYVFGADHFYAIGAQQ